MSSDPQSKPEIIIRLRQIQHDLANSVRSMSDAQFERGSAQSWSPEAYLKHLLLSIKPFGKALSFPPDALKRRFGEVTRPPFRYTEVEAQYQARLAQGIRAEDYEAVTPTTFRLPEGTTDVQATLIDLWDEAHERMITGLEHWSEADLDTVQILHPALGAISVRAMLFFTIFHNALHAGDIAAAGQQQSLP
jgi:DinB superfamily